MGNANRIWKVARPFVQTAIFAPLWPFCHEYGNILQFIRYGTASHACRICPGRYSPLSGKGLPAQMPNWPQTGHIDAAWPMQTGYGKLPVNLSKRPYSPPYGHFAMNTETSCNLSAMKRRPTLAGFALGDIRHYPARVCQLKCRIDAIRLY